MKSSHSATLLSNTRVRFLKKKKKKKSYGTWNNHNSGYNQVKRYTILTISTMLISTLSATTLLGAPSDVYLTGTMYTLISAGAVIAVPIAAYLYLPIFFDLQVVSANEVFTNSFHTIFITIFFFHSFAVPRTAFRSPRTAHRFTVVHLPTGTFIESITIWFPIIYLNTINLNQ